MSRGGKREGAGRKRKRPLADQEVATSRVPHEQGRIITYYLDAYEWDFLKAGVLLDGLEVCDARVRGKARSIFKEALRVEMLRILQHPDLPKQFSAGSENSAENT